MLRMEDLAELAATFNAAGAGSVRSYAIGGEQFDFSKRPHIMGVINLSSDSWYRESVCLSADAAIQRAAVLKAQGAEIIDIGAESTLAHAKLADAALQQSQLLPVIRALRAKGILVSAETYQPEVARACLEAGANIINLTGNEHLPEIARMVADHDAALILCYVQGPDVRHVQDFDFSSDPVRMMRDHFERLCEVAVKSGAQKLFIDPGLGFYYRNLQDSAVRVRHQMKVFLNTFRLRDLGFPVCHALPHAFEYFGEEVRCAEPFFAVLAALGKTDLFRTHEVPRTKAVLDTMQVY